MCTRVGRKANPFDQCELLAEFSRRRTAYPPKPSVRGRDPQLFGAAVIVVDEDNVSIVLVEQGGGDGSTVAAGAVDPQFAVRGKPVDAFGQFVQCDVDRATHMASRILVGVADIQHRHARLVRDRERLEVNFQRVDRPSLPS